MNNLLTPKQVMELFHITRGTLKTWDKTGRLPAIRIGDRRDRRFKQEDVDRILQEKK